MAKKPQTMHGKALAAFTTQRITRAEYIKCVNGWAEIRGAYITFHGPKMIYGRLTRPRSRRLDKIIHRIPAPAANK